MKLFRFMSKNEFDKYLAGETLVNTTDHRHKHSNSVGFCFFEYLDLNDKNNSLDGITPTYAIEFIYGVATTEIVAVFETDKELTKSSGMYADPHGGWFDTMWMDEYCTEEYDNQSFCLIKYGTIEEYSDDINWIDASKEERVCPLEWWNGGNVKKYVEQEGERA